MPGECQRPAGQDFPGIWGRYLMHACPRSWRSVWNLCTHPPTQTLSCALRVLRFTMLNAVHNAHWHVSDVVCRGIRTREALVGEEAALPVVVVPEKLYLTARSADAVLSPALRAAGKAPLHERLNSGMQLAVLLAHQRCASRPTLQPAQQLHSEGKALCCCAPRAGCPGSVRLHTVRVA